MRGKVVCIQDGQAKRGFIPAPAGKSFETKKRGRPSRIHHRTCGEKSTMRVYRIVRIDSSPHLLGKVQDCKDIIAYLRFIPAPAGKRPLVCKILIPFAIHPRVCGEKRHNPPDCIRVFGFIPAYAGKSSRTLKYALVHQIHPRVCGEKFCTASANSLSVDSSPRMRGKAR